MGSFPRRPGAGPHPTRPLSVLPAVRPSGVVLFGTGALACAIGARLARAGERVTLVGTWAAARAALLARGIVVHDREGTWSAPVESAPPEGIRGPVEVALVVVKSQKTASVAPALARVLSPAGLVVTLQNGLGPREVLAGAIGGERVAVGVAFLGARLLGPGEVSVVPGRLVLGEEPGTAGPVRRLATRLRGAGLEVETSGDVERVVWAKLAANCAINPLTALHGVPNGALLKDPALRRTMRAAAREVAAVAAARGLDLGPDAASLAEQVAEATADNRSSMLQDLERGATTEIDALNGAVAAEARRLRVEAPVNDDLWRRLRAREGRPVGAGAARPGPPAGAEGGGGAER
jgi:2-dehydropantoate 2-reductase